MMTEQKDKCPKCDGEGEIRWTQIDEPVGEDGMAFRLGVGVWECEKDCPTCKGTGRITNKEGQEEIREGFKNLICRLVKIDELENCESCEKLGLKPICSIRHNADEYLNYLHSQGYVKWDREKVAQMGYEFLGIGWDKLTEASKDIFRERADQIIALFPDEEERSIRINKILDRVNQQHAVELKDASCVGLENCCDLETRLKDARKQERDGMMALVETFMWFNNDDAACGLKAGSTKFTKVWQALKEE